MRLHATFQKILTDDLCDLEQKTARLIVTNKMVYIFSLHNFPMKTIFQVETRPESAERPIFRLIFQLQGGLTHDLSSFRRGSKTCKSKQMSGSYNTLRHGDK